MCAHKIRQLLSTERGVSRSLSVKRVKMKFIVLPIKPVSVRTDLSTVTTSASSQDSVKASKTQSDIAKSVSPHQSVS